MTFFVSSLHGYLYSVKYHTVPYTVHDTENLTFSAEFRDCSARNDAEFPRGCRGTSAQVPRNFRAGAAELPRGRRGTSARVDADLPCGFGLKMAKFVRNNAKGSRNTPQGSFELSL